MKLFCSQDISSFFDYRIAKMKDEIAALSDQEVLTVDLEEWKHFFKEKYTIEPLEIYEDRITYDVVQGVIESYDGYSSQRYDTDGYIVKFKIPFDGDSQLFHCHPSQYYWMNFNVYDLKEADNESEGYLIFRFEYSRERITKNLPGLKDFLIESFRKKFTDYASMIQFVNNDVASYNNGLTGKIERFLNERKEKSDEWFKITQALEIPLTLDKNAPNTVPIMLKKKRKEFIKKPESKTLSPEYCISDEDYNNITNIINSCCTAMERNARTFNKIPEEELRDFITATLNTHYVDEVSSETFRRRGKTDILISFNNAEAFIAECKIWHGPKLLQDTYDQLLCYTTWRDVKTAIVLFNKNNKNFKNIQNQVEDWIKQNSKAWSKRNGNVWECTFYNQDTGNDIKVAVCLYDLSVRELPSVINKK